MRNRREPSSHLLLQEWHNTEGITLIQRGRESYEENMSDLYVSYKLIRAFGVPTNPMFVYGSALFFNGLKVQKEAVDRIVEVKKPLLFFGTSLRSVRVGPVIWLALDGYLRNSTANAC